MKHLAYTEVLFICLHLHAKLCLEENAHIGTCLSFGTGSACGMGTIEITEKRQIVSYRERHEKTWLPNCMTRTISRLKGGRMP